MNEQTKRTRSFTKYSNKTNPSIFEVQSITDNMHSNLPNCCAIHVMYFQCNLDTFPR